MIKLTDIAKEILNEDRCKRIADRRYDKPSAYKSGAIVRCRKGNIWKGIKEERQENAMPSAFVRVFKVKSKSKNKTYEVSFQINTKQLSCGCTGYGYRRTCSHVKAVANKLGV